MDDSGGALAITEMPADLLSSETGGICYIDGELRENSMKRPMDELPESTSRSLQNDSNVSTGS